jgi:hypothetical protein
MKSKPIFPASVCAYFTDENPEALIGVGTTPLVKSGPNGQNGRNLSEETPQPLLSKRGPKAHFEPEGSESSPLVKSGPNGKICRNLSEEAHS